MCFEISQKNHKSLRKNSLPKKVLCKKSCTLLGETIVALNQNINDTKGDFSAKEIRLICSNYSISSDCFVSKKITKNDERDIDNEKSKTVIRFYLYG